MCGKGWARVKAGRPNEQLGRRVPKPARYMYDLYEQSSLRASVRVLATHVLIESDYDTHNRGRRAGILAAL